MITGYCKILSLVLILRDTKISFINLRMKFHLSPFKEHFVCQVCSHVLRGHRTDDSVVLAEPMSRFGLSLGSLGLCLLWPLRGQGKPGLPLFVKFFPNCKQTTIAKMTKKGYKSCSVFNMLTLSILMS